MFETIKNAWNLIQNSIQVFNRHPKFLIPLLITWLVYAPITLYLEYGFNWRALSVGQIFLFVFGIIFLFAFLLGFSCLILLELIQQLESRKELDLGKAFVNSLTGNILKFAPIVLVWTIVWFTLLILDVLVSIFFGETRERRGSLTLESAAKTLAGYGIFSLISSFFALLKRGARMIVFIIAPAIAWENLSFGKAIKRGFNVFTLHTPEFSTGFILTWVAAAIIFLPLTILFWMSGVSEITFPNWVWLLAIIYTAFAWSYSLYLEQMFIAQLYLWHLKWEKQIEKEKRHGKQLSKLKDVKKPSLLDEIFELSEIRNGQGPSLTKRP